MALRVKFWGCRGSIACPSPRQLKYGGNTTCLEIDAGEHKFTLDSSTGIRNLGREMMSGDKKQFHILLTHTHWDYINGFPFFAPAFEPNERFHILAGHMQGKGGIESVFATQMDNPVFPIPLEAMQAELIFEDFKAGESLDIAPAVSIRTAPLNHPNGSTGYRFDFQGKSLCFITDTEHIPGKPDENIFAFV